MREFIFRIITSFVLIFFLFLSFKYNNFFFTIFNITLIWSYYEYIQLIKKIKITKFLKNFSIYFAFLYLVFVSSYILINYDEIKNILFYFLIICICTDIGGLILGKTFKGKKLTKISPNKTYSGFYGSFIVSFLVMFFMSNYLNLNIYILIIFTFTVCLLSQLGDLFFSYLKRLCKVKDTGKILPGHGGILDRVDGIIVSVPINILIYTISI